MLYSEFKSGKIPYELVKLGFPKTTVSRQYKKFCKEKGIEEQTRFSNTFEKIIDNKYFKKINKDGYEKYLISDDGEIYSLRNSSIFKPVKDRDGYLCAGLVNTNDNIRHYCRVHELVLITFGSKPPSDMITVTCDHINGTIDDNRVSNLRWLERSINSSKPFKHSVCEGRVRKYLPEIIERVCDMLSKGYSIQETSKKNKCS